MELTVRSVETIAEDVALVELAHPRGELLPPWSPGAHVDITLPSGRVRQYSLCGDELESGSYKIAVLHDRAGRGGSAELHSSKLIGSVLDVGLPRNLFPLHRSDSYLFVAGGIGITPLRAMIRSVHLSGADWRLVYRARSRRRMAFLDELREWGGERVLARSSDEGDLRLDDLIEMCSPSTLIYCCGPNRLMDAVDAVCRAHHCEDRLHIERFTAGPASNEGTSGAGSFSVRLHRTDVVVEVGPTESILEALRPHVDGLCSSCEMGFCGSCETRVLSGAPDHRDTVLTDAERAANKTMMICVSRAHGPLVLDL